MSETRFSSRSFFVINKSIPGGRAEDIPAGHRAQEAGLPVLRKAQRIEHSDSVFAECVGENYPCAVSERDETRALFIESSAYSP